MAIIGIPRATERWRMLYANHVTQSEQHAIGSVSSQGELSPIEA